MPKDHRLKTRMGSSPQNYGAPKQQQKGLILPINFLLSCSDDALGSYELARLAEIADFRAELHVLLDHLIDTSAHVAVVRWFRKTDRQILRDAIENEESPLEWAKRMVREGQRTEEELIPLAAFEPGAAHLAAAMRYQERNIAEGKCQSCPQPLDPNSIRYCTKHLAAKRNRHQKKGKAEPGSREWLYSEELQPSTHGRQPGTLASLAMNREKKTRAVLAELGIKPEHAAVSVNAAKEALLRVMPDSKDKAMGPADLFRAAMIPSRTTGDKALRELLEPGKIQRIGKARKGHSFRYFKSSWKTESPEVPASKNSSLMPI